MSQELYHLTHKTYLQWGTNASNCVLGQEQSHKVLCIARDVLPGTAGEIWLLRQDRLPDLQACVKWSVSSRYDEETESSVAWLPSQLAAWSIQGATGPQTCESVGLRLLRRSSKGMKPLRSWYAITPADHRSLAG